MTFRFGVIAECVLSMSPCNDRSTIVFFRGLGSENRRTCTCNTAPRPSQSVGVRGREGWGGWRGWSHLGASRQTVFPDAGTGWQQQQRLSCCPRLVDAERTPVVRNCTDKLVINFINWGKHFNKTFDAHKSEEFPIFNIHTSLKKKKTSRSLQVLKIHINKHGSLGGFGFA